MQESRENNQQTKEISRWNRDIQRSAYAVGLGGLLFVLGGVYFSEVEDRGSFSETNRFLYASLKESIDRFSQAPRGLGPYN